MVVGYSLGNRNDVEDDIQVIGEDGPNIITYSKSLPLILSRMCRNDCPYCGFHKKDNIIVPYSTIRAAKQARSKGAREIFFVSGERPDKFPHIRAILDLWGFSSYLEYVYTVCELGFLEGLIPVIELGFLSPIEMKRMAEVSALVKIMMDSVDEKTSQNLYKNSPGKRLELRLKSLEWAGKLNYPVITGNIVGIGQSKENQKSVLNKIAALHREYGHIHEYLVQNFVPEPKTPFEKKKPADKADVLKAIDLAREILPDDIPITVNMELYPDFEDFIKAGVRDLGRITEGEKGLITGQTPLDELDVAERLDKLGFKLQQRFPLRKAFISEGKYSKKLGQVFESYRYKIKKEAQEKLKESKAIGYDA